MEMSICISYDIRKDSMRRKKRHWRKEGAVKHVWQKAKKEATVEREDTRGVQVVGDKDRASLFEMS